MPESELVLQMNDITKNFSGVRALDSVSISLKKGEVLGLLGENGAGKSTLIKILSGAYSLEVGEIIIEGERVVFENPGDSLKHGVRVIYQELSSFDPISVAENIFAGELVTKKSGVVDWKHMVKESQKVLSYFDSDINPLQVMENLQIAEKQIVEIAKAVHTKAKIIVMDEPTSALNERDVNTLYTIIRRLKSDGISIIYITHRLEEISAITDRTVVLRDGRKVGDVLTRETSRPELVNMIVGKSFSELYPKKSIAKGEVIFEVKGLSYLDKLLDISFCLRAGEIVAFFGLLGSGTHLLFNVLFGDIRKTAGEILIDGKGVRITHPAVAKKSGLGFVPVDRKEEGVAIDMDVKTNIAAANFENLGDGVRINKKMEKEHAEKWVHTLSIKTPTVRTTLSSLSGGNQQKVVVAKWLERESRILLMAEPTRGIDVGSKAEVYKIAEEFCEKGSGVLIVSSELPEIMAISDRIIVMKDGRIAGEYRTEETNPTELMHVVTS
jgi:ABC-type sugar transport system ATPase subunit